MKVVIPVAGIGTRLKPHTHTVPKPLLRIGGKAIIDYLLQPLVELSPEEVIFVIGYKGSQIREHVSQHYSFRSTFIEQDQLLGLGYAVHVAMEKVGDSPVLVILGDTIVEYDLKKFVGKGEYALGLREVDDPSRFGIAEISDGYVVNVEEKPSHPKTNLALIGLYYFKESGLLKQELTRLVDSGKKTRGEIQLTDALAGMVKAGARFVPHEVNHWYDCGKKETMLSTNRHFLQKLPHPGEIKGSVIIPPVFIADSAVIINSVVGPYVTVSDEATIRNSVISDSIIGANTRLENIVITESIIGNDVSLRGGKKIVNVGDSTEIDSL